MASFITVLSSLHQTRRQVSRALYSGGAELRFLERPSDFQALASSPDEKPSLLILDVDGLDAAGIDQCLTIARGEGARIPVIILSLGQDKGALLDLLSRYEIGNLVAKHGAIRAVYPVLDERELLVTCQKVLRRDIFGIDKYLGSWGIAVHRAQLAGMPDKNRVLSEFEGFLTDLACPPPVVPDMLMVADELMVNAIVHAPRDERGQPKYRHLGPLPDLVLEPEDIASVEYACDGQRLMFSVSDRFGALDRATLQSYVARGFGGQKLSIEEKASGAGIGLSMSFRRIHQLVFNIQDGVRTEVIAGWYMRVENATEFRKVSKSMNVFWLPREIGEIAYVEPEAPPPVAIEPARTISSQSLPGQLPSVALLGRIDERTHLPVAESGARFDLRGVTGFSSTGVVHWLKMIASLNGRRLELVACPEPLVRLASEVDGMLAGCTVISVLAPFECDRCGDAQQLELEPEKVLLDAAHRCTSCQGTLRFTGLPWEYDNLVPATRAVR